MEFFERAHVTRKDYSKRENNSDDAVKKQLKQMLNAYKKGNNQEIKSCIEAEHKYEIDDIKISVNDYSDLSFHNTADSSKNLTKPHEYKEPEYAALNSSSTEQSLCKSDVSEPITDDNLDSESDFSEDEIQSFSTSQDSTITGKGISLPLDNSSVLSMGSSNDTEFSIPTSLQTSNTGSDVSDDEGFDLDGALASKILEKLSEKQITAKKRKNTNKNKNNDTKVIKKESKKDNIKSIVKKEKKKDKNATKSEGLSDRKAFKILNEESQKIDITDATDSTFKNIKTDMSEDSFHGQSNIDDSSSSNDSSVEFISLSVSNMPNESLNDIIGGYVHPAVRNLPSETRLVTEPLSIGYDISSDDNMEDISSIIPEVDEELTLGDLTLDTDTQEVEETTLYDDTVQSEDYFEHELSEEDIEPNSIKVYNGRNNYVLVMNASTKLYVHGKVKVTAFGRAVDIFGYTLEDESVDVYAPYCYFAHCIKPVQCESTFKGLFGNLMSAGLQTYEAENILKTVDENGAVISLSKLNNQKIDFVDNNFTPTELFSKRVDKTPTFLKKVADILDCSLYLDQPTRSLQDKGCWEELVNVGMNEQSRGIICGGKGTGKSTFLRYYVNRLLNNGPVLVIDLDPGQSEFTVPGNISATVVDCPLIGPNFTHLRKPQRTLNLGMINTMDNPCRYISAVTDLMTYCHSNEAFHTMPWIVNTMGMCNYMGLKFITNIIIQVQPTFLYQIDGKSAKNKFDFELHSQTIKNLYENFKRERLFSNVTDLLGLDYKYLLEQYEESSPRTKMNTFSLSPRDERYLNVLAYFGDLLNIHGKNILEIVPYEVNIREFRVGVNVKIPEEYLMKVINGKIIALCQLTSADKAQMFKLGDSALLSHGYGLIRSIDFENGLLYILTPVSLEELNLVNAIVYADWMPELRGQEKELPNGTMLPYRSTTEFHQRKFMFPPKRRFNPIQLLKATKKS